MRKENLLSGSLKNSEQWVISSEQWVFRFALRQNIWYLDNASIFLSGNLKIIS